MPQDSTLAHPAPPPCAKFTDAIHAMTTRTACDTAALGLDRLLSNLQRMQVPAELEDSFNRIALQLAEGLQLIGNLKQTFDTIAEKQPAEGSI